MDAMHLGNLWNKLGRSSKAQHYGATVPASRAADLLDLVSSTQARLHDCRRPDVLANIAHGAANVGLEGEAASTLFGAVAVAAVPHTARCEPRHLANLAWGFATMSQSHPQLFDAIAAAATPKLASTFNGQELGMLAWAFAKMDHRHSALITGFAVAVCARATELEPQSLATLALSLIKLDATHARAKRATTGMRAMKRLARAARARMEAFNPQDLDNLSSAYARLSRPRWGGKLAAAIAGAAVKRGIATFPSRHLTNVMWGVAKLASACKLANGAVVSEPAIVRLAAECSRVVALRAAECNARDLSNAAWAFLILGRFERETMLAIARKAATTLDTFNAQETSKLLYAMHKANIHCAALETAAAAQREHLLDIAPHGGPPVRLTHILGGGRARGGREETGATAATGGALWEGSLLLAKWLARHPTPVAASASLPTHGTMALERGRTPDLSTWDGLVAVELGAGLGLPSIIAARLGLRTVATDADDDVLSLLQANTAADRAAVVAAAAGGGGHVLSTAAAVAVERLKWGEDADPTQRLGLHGAPDVLLAVDVVYGKEEKVWAALVDTLVKLSNEATLILMAHGNGAAPGVHRMSGRFYEMAGEHFESTCLAADAEHPGCQIHCMTRRPHHSSGAGRSGRKGELDHERIGAKRKARA